MEKVLFATVGRQTRPIFSGDDKVIDDSVFEAYKSVYVADCIKSGSQLPTFEIKKVGK